jgi:hypothetical protein
MFPTKALPPCGTFRAGNAPTGAGVLWGLVPLGEVHWVTGHPKPRASLNRPTDMERVKVLPGWNSKDKCWALLIFMVIDRRLSDRMDTQMIITTDFFCMKDTWGLIMALLQRNVTTTQMLRRSREQWRTGRSGIRADARGAAASRGPANHACRVWAAASSQRGPTLSPGLHL